MKTLIINLTGPLQSYGNQASFDRRTTDDYPSKSAVVGLLAAALGYRRRDSRIKTLNQLHFAVRIDQVGIPLSDFQTVEWKPQTRKVTHRDYLQDARFVVALGSPDGDLLKRLKIALAHPRFQLFLGRRANTLAGPLKTDIRDEDPIHVLKTLAWQAAEWYQRRQPQKVMLTIMADGDLLPELPSTMVKDQVESLDQRDRRYEFRALASLSVDFNNPNPKPVLDFFNGIG